MRVVFLVGAAAFALSLAACGGPPSAKSKGPTQVGTAGATAASGPTAGASATGAPAASDAQASSADPRDAPVPVSSDGKPEWAANRKHTTEENADYQFGKNGKDFDATTEAAYVAKVHAFIDSPPSSVEKIERSNGDALLYDARTNTFAVVSKTGAPRTMFKPRDGANYWRQQEARETARAKGGDDNSES